MTEPRYKTRKQLNLQFYPEDYQRLHQNYRTFVARTEGVVVPLHEWAKELLLGENNDRENGVREDKV